MKCGAEADRFGKFVVENLHDTAIDRFDRLVAGGSKAPADQLIQSRLTGINAETKALLRTLIVDCVQHGMGTLLQALDDTGEVAVEVNDVNIAVQSDGLCGELWGKNGWIAKHSKNSVL